VALGKRTVSFKAKGEKVTREVFPVDPCALKAETLPGCHREVPAGNLTHSLEQKGDWVIRLEAGSGAAIGRMLRGALLSVLRSEALAGVQRLGATEGCLVVVELVDCHREVPGANLTPSFMAKELWEMMDGEL
jgi:hypothetical protein